MTPKLSSRILGVLSLLYGVLVGLVAVLDGPVALVAIIGGIIMGVLWVLRGVFINRGATRNEI